MVGAVDAPQQALDGDQRPAPTARPASAPRRINAPARTRSATVIKAASHEHGAGEGDAPTVVVSDQAPERGSAAIAARAVAIHAAISATLPGVDGGGGGYTGCRSRTENGVM